MQKTKEYVPSPTTKCNHITPPQFFFLYCGSHTEYICWPKLTPGIHFVNLNNAHRTDEGDLEGWWVIQRYPNKAEMSLGSRSFCADGFSLKLWRKGCAGIFMQTILAS